MTDTAHIHQLYTSAGTPQHHFAYNGGITRPAIRIYARWVADPIFEREPTPEEVRLIADYCQYWINQPALTFPAAALRELRRSIVYVETASQLYGWLTVCAELTFRPLGII